MVIQIETMKIGCDSAPVLGILALDFFQKLSKGLLLKETNRSIV